MATSPTCAKCGRGCDPYGDHTVSCIKAGLVRRHYDVVNEIRALLTSAGVETQAEVVLAPELRVDLVAKKSEFGCDVAYDVTVAHPLTTRPNIGAASCAEMLKINKYSDACAHWVQNFIHYHLTLSEAWARNHIYKLENKLRM